MPTNSNSSAVMLLSKPYKRNSQVNIALKIVNCKISRLFKREQIPVLGELESLEAWFLQHQSLFVIGSDTLKL